MKYCLTDRVSKEYLTMADEIKCTSAKNLFDLVDDCQADLIYHLSFADEHDLHSLMNIKDKIVSLGRRFILELEDLTLAAECKEHGFEFYSPYTASSYWDLRALKDLGVCYVYLDADLFFDIKYASTFGIPIRITPAVAWSSIIPKNNFSYCGTWVRPEDMEMYDEYVAAAEFPYVEPKQEQGLFKVYKKGVWDGDLNILIKNLDFSCRNARLINKFGESRLDCRQKCMKGTCHMCETAIRLTQDDMWNQIKPQ